MFRIHFKFPRGNTCGLNECIFLFSLKPLMKYMHKSLPFLRKALQPFSCWHRLRFMKTLLIADDIKKIKALLMLSGFFINVVMRFMLMLMVKCKYRNLSWALVKPVNSKNWDLNWRTDSSWFHIHIKYALSQRETKVSKTRTDSIRQVIFWPQKRVLQVWTSRWWCLRISVLIAVGL